MVGDKIKKNIKKHNFLDLKDIAIVDVDDEVNKDVING